MLGFNPGIYFLDIRVKPEYDKEKRPNRHKKKPSGGRLFSLICFYATFASVTLASKTISAPSISALVPPAQLLLTLTARTCSAT